MKIVESKIKLDKEGFNECPPRQYVLDGIKNNAINAKFVDLIDEDYWKNENDTLVIAFRAGDNIDEILTLISFLRSCDELHHTVTEDMIILRFWWD